MNKQQAMMKIRKDVVLSQIAECEPVVFDQIVTTALTYDLADNRWRAYEQLKRKASQIVGWKASHEELASSAHYRAMIDFIDWLLPVGYDEYQVS